MDTFVVVPKGFVPKFLRPVFGGKDELRIGPIPEGTPIGLIANLDMDPGTDKIPRLVNILRDFIKVKKGKDFTTQLAQDLRDLSKCPDYVIDRGHEYGSGLSDREKRALIEYTKNF